MAGNKLFSTPEGPDTAKVAPDPAFIADVRCLLPTPTAFMRVTGLPRPDVQAFMQGKPIRKDRLDVARQRFYGEFGSTDKGVLVMDTKGPWLMRRLTAAADMIQAAGDRLYIPPESRAYYAFPPKSALRHACEVLEELVDTLCTIHQTNPEMENSIYAKAPQARQIVKRRFEALTGRSWYGSSRVHNRKLSKVQGDAKASEFGTEENGPPVQPVDTRPGQPSSSEVQD